VFCLDNITVNCSADDIRSYMSNLLIHVISCFRSSNDDDDDDDERIYFDVA